MPILQVLVKKFTSTSTSTSENTSTIQVQVQGPEEQALWLDFRDPGRDGVYSRDFRDGTGFGKKFTLVPFQFLKQT